MKLGCKSTFWEAEEANVDGCACLCSWVRQEGFRDQSRLNLSTWAKSCRAAVPEQLSSLDVAESQGGRNTEDRWKQEDVLSSSIKSTAPVLGGVASGQTRQKEHNAYPCSFHPSGSSERPPIWKSDGGAELFRKEVEILIPR